MSPLAKALARAGVSPDTITLLVPPLVLITCLWFVRTRAVLPFCGVVLTIASLDALDGAVARAGHKTTKQGAYLDAMSDRYVEAMIAISAAYVTGYWLLTSIVLAGSLLVSYAKARAAMEVAVTNLEWPDLAERTERGVVFLLGLAASAVFPLKPAGRDLFWWTLVLLAVATHATVAQRMLRACGYIRVRQQSR